MPRLKIDPSQLLTPAMQSKMVDFVQREAKELADIGIDILAEALKRRLAQSRQRRVPGVAGQDWNGRVHQPGPPRARSPYQALGVSPDTPMEEIESAFRKRVMKCHPDKGGDEEELRLVLVAIRQIREERKL